MCVIAMRTACHEVLEQGAFPKGAPPVCVNDFRLEALPETGLKVAIIFVFLARYCSRHKADWHNPRSRNYPNMASSVHWPYGLSIALISIAFCQENEIFVHFSLEMRSELCDSRPPEGDVEASIPAACPIYPQGVYSTQNDAYPRGA